MSTIDTVLINDAFKFHAFNDIFDKIPHKVSSQMINNLRKKST